MTSETGTSGGQQTSGLDIARPAGTSATVNPVTGGPAAGSTQPAPMVSFQPKLVSGSEQDLMPLLQGRHVVEEERSLPDILSLWDSEHCEARRLLSIHSGELPVLANQQAPAQAVGHL